MSKETRRAVMQNIGYLTQLGFSIAFPMIICTMGSVWLSRRFGLGGWFVMLGVMFGLISGISCFVTFTKHVMKQSRKDDSQDGSRR